MTSFEESEASAEPDLMEAARAHASELLAGINVRTSERRPTATGGGAMWHPDGRSSSSSAPSGREDPRIFIQNSLELFTRLSQQIDSSTAPHIAAQLPKGQGS